MYDDVSASVRMTAGRLESSILPHFVQGAKYNGIVYALPAVVTRAEFFSCTM